MIFTSADIKKRLQDAPFVPLRIVTTTGQTYDVYHPDLVMVAQRFIMVGTPSKDDPSVSDLVTRIAFVHLAEFQDLQHPTQTSNGKPQS